MKLNFIEKKIPVTSENNEFDSLTHLKTINALDLICEQLNINEIIRNETLHRYKFYVTENQDVKITNHKVLMALSFLATIRQSDTVALTFSEIIQAFRENGYRVTNKNILNLANKLDINLSPMKAEEYIERVVSSVINHHEVKAKIEENEIEIETHEYQQRLSELSYRFLSYLNRNDRGGVQPFPLAISIVYLADRALCTSLDCLPILTHELMEKATGGSKFTVRDHIYRFLGKYYDKYEEDLINY